jgi:hypothetical protein
MESLFITLCVGLAGDMSAKETLGRGNRQYKIKTRLK